MGGAAANQGIAAPAVTTVIEQVIATCGNIDQAYEAATSWYRTRLLHVAIRTIDGAHFVNIDGLTSSTYDGRPEGFYVEGELASVSGDANKFTWELNNGRYGDAGWPVERVEIARDTNGWFVNFEAVGQYYDTAGLIACSVDRLALASLTRE